MGQSAPAADDSSPGERGITRLAPSPTGALHLGNVRTFLINWAIARKSGWRIILRIEDLDTPRIKPGAAERLTETLGWLGLDWDEGPLIQSDDLEPHRRGMRLLAERALAYPCRLSRKQIEEAASAPHASYPGDSRPDEPRESVFPIDLRPSLGPRRFDDDRTNWRFVVPDEEVAFDDAFAGLQSLRPARAVGDFVIWTKRGQPAYQLAVVVDDHRQGVTEVVRGSDLLDSAARQLLLYRSLGYRLEPRYTHVPLVVGPDGRRLAKRHGDTRIDHYRRLGIGAEAIIGLIGAWSCPDVGRRRPEPMTAGQFEHAFDLSRMSTEPIVFSAEDDAWLVSQARA